MPANAMAQPRASTAMTAPPAAAETVLTARSFGRARIAAAARSGRTRRRRDREGGPGEGRPAARFQDKKFGDKKPYTPREGGEKRPYTPRGEGFRKDGDRPRGDRPFSARPPREGDRPERKFGGDKKFSRGRAGPWSAQEFRRSSARRGDSKAVAEARCLLTRSCRPQFASLA